MTYQEYLKSQGYTDAEVQNMTTTFGADKLAKAFEQPIQAAEAAARDLAAAKTEREEFQNFYETDVLPKVGQTYQDAINARTEVAALKARLDAAKEYGFLSEPAPGVVPGSPAGRPVTTTTGQPQVPGSPAAPGAPAFDPAKYVEASKFTEAVNSIPDMLGRLSDVSNEYYRLYGQPIPDSMTSLIDEARKNKKTVTEIAAAKYKFDEKRAQIASDKQAAHDKQVADDAIRKYASEHNMPFTAPGMPSRAPLFTPKATGDDNRHPWKGARERKQERKEKLIDALTQRGVPASASTRPN